MSEHVRTALATVVEGGTLGRDEARLAMGAVMDGDATPAQLAALLVALRMRGETIDELAGFASAMREHAVRVEAPAGTIDTCGTGGDGRGTFNISTAAALVAAADGVPVAKHGNRAITSRAGSFDVLDALGIVVQQSAAEAAASLREDGFAFLFAGGYHPAMRHAGPTRQEIGIRTAFNLLGPLTNPAGAARQVIGVGDAAAAPRVAAVLHALGTERSFVVHGDRIDELPLDGSGVMYDVGPDGVRRSTVDVAALGLAPAPTEALTGGTPAENAATIEALFAGRAGPQRDVVLLNAAAAFLVAGRVPDLRAGIARAARVIDDGSAARLVERLRARRIRVEAERAAAAAAAAPAGGAADQGGVASGAPATTTRGAPGSGAPSGRAAAQSVTPR